jgi:hypothetical protein
VIGMSKRVTTGSYIGAWIVAVLAFVVFFKTLHLTTSAGYVTAIGTSPTSVRAWLLVILAGLVTIVMWVAALAALGEAHRWGWFVAVLALQLVGLGIIGMAGYAIAGPRDAERENAVRPSFS